MAGQRISLGNTIGNRSRDSKWYLHSEGGKLGLYYAGNGLEVLPLGPDSELAFDGLTHGGFYESDDNWLLLVDKDGKRRLWRLNEKYGWMEVALGAVASIGDDKQEISV